MPGFRPWLRYLSICAFVIAGRILVAQDLSWGCRDELHSSVLSSLDDLRVTHDDIFWRGRRVVLRPILRRLLIALIDRPDQIISVEVLVADVWPEKEPGFDGSSSVRRAAYEIRRAFRAVDPEFSALKTEFGHGLRWQTSAGSACARIVAGVEFLEHPRHFRILGKIYRLNASEAQVLRLLACGYPRPVPWEKLSIALRKISWSRDANYAWENRKDRVRYQILRMRKKFDPDGFDPFSAVPSFGYRWIVPSVRDRT